MLSDSSEIQEAVRLFREMAVPNAISAASGVTVGPLSLAWPTPDVSPSPRSVVSDLPGSRPAAAPEKASAPPPSTVQSLPAQVAPPALPDSPDLPHAERLERLLTNLCRRAGLSGAVAADETGLPLAVHGRTVPAESLVALTSVLSEALQKAARFLGRAGADYISMDVDYENKIALKSFRLDGRLFSLMVLCSQTVDERSELEVSIGELVAVLSRETPERPR
jgi:hypothetical protein